MLEKVPQRRFNPELINEITATPANSGAHFPLFVAFCDAQLLLIDNRGFSFPQNKSIQHDTAPLKMLHSAVHLQMHGMFVNLN
jgi:hypothetical protein